MIDLFEDVQRHELSAGRRPAVVFTTKLSRLQRRILRLLKMRRPTTPDPDSGHPRKFEDIPLEMCGKSLF